MPSDAVERLMNEEEIEAVRERAAQRIKDFVSLNEASRHAGIAYPTLSAWMNRTYKGRNDRVAQQVERWLNSDEAREQTIAASPTAPTFVRTPTAEAIIAVLQQAQHMPDFAVVTGAPGIGKTTTACRYTRETPNVWKIEAHPSLHSPRHVLTELARALGIQAPTLMHVLQRMIVQKLRGIPALIIVDEAQHLSAAALDQLRSIHDQAECGLVLLGNPGIHGRLEGNGRTAEFAQLFSRVGVRLTAKSKTGDADRLIEAWGIEDAPQRDFLRVIAKKPGALRGMTKTLRLAFMMASAERQPVGLEHLRMAWQQLGNSPVAEAG